MKTRNLLPNIILSVILICSFILFFIGNVVSATNDRVDQNQEQTSLQEIETPSVVYNELSFTPIFLTFKETEDREELKKLIEECCARKEAAHLMAESARALGYTEDYPIIHLAKQEWDNSDALQKKYELIYKQNEYDIWDNKFAEYPEATQIWLYLKELGYNDYVCAGIMGNLMTEVGGNTLYIQHWLYSSDKSFYGMCQWSKTYYPEIHGADLTTQCNFLRDTIKYEIDTFGYAYKRNFDYSAFLALTNERDAALAFAKTYERCAEFSYSTREKNATIAYEYFVE